MAQRDGVQILIKASRLWLVLLKSCHSVHSVHQNLEISCYPFQGEDCSAAGVATVELWFLSSSGKSGLDSSPFLLSSQKYCRLCMNLTVNVYFPYCSYSSLYSYTEESPVWGMSVVQPYLLDPWCTAESEVSALISTMKMYFGTLAHIWWGFFNLHYCM